MIAVIDYELGNLRSVSKALESIGTDVEVSSRPQVIKAAQGMVLPGVGSFYKGMENLCKSGLSYYIPEFVKSGKPLLGICLGMQLLFSEGHEHGVHKGLDLIKGKVKKIEGSVKIPHMGWNTVKQVRGSRLFKDIPKNSYFYFVHSYIAEPADKKIILGQTQYSKPFSSVVKKNKVFGLQFHPEKSGKLGLKILENFVKLC